MEVRENIMGYLIDGHGRQENSKRKGPAARLWLTCLGNNKEARAEEPFSGRRVMDETKSKESDPERLEAPVRTLICGSI